jgi:6-hydroxycyclohex-1-ene-1-carbonyl-CoA dehydrogenase
VGFTLDKTQVRLSNLMAYNARMQGNWGCVPEYYPEALGLVLSKKIEMKPFVHQYPLDEINSVMEAVHSHAVNERPILVP